jgi:hypothetical protein
MESPASAGLFFWREAAAGDVALDQFRVVPAAGLEPALRFLRNGF